MSDSMSEPPDRREDAVSVVRALRGAGHVAYFAGGCVRDELLGLVPKDYDVATDAHPDVVREVFGKRRTRPVGAAFGVILVRAGRSNIEVATFRADLEYHDGRRPSGVIFTSAQEDALRRDFTINGLFRDPLAQEADPTDDGVIDYVDGKHDLRDRILRAIGKADQRFNEDYLRMLRAVRFASRFGLTIEPLTWEAMIRNAPRLSVISPERVADEVRRMLSPPTRGEAWRLLWESGLLATIFRDLPEPVGEIPRHRPVLEHLSRLQRPISLGLALAGTLIELRHAAGRGVRRILEPGEVKQAQRICRRAFHFSNEESDNLAGAMGLWPLLQDTPPTVARLKRFLAGPYSGDGRELLAALTFDPILRPRIAWLQERFAALEQEEVAPPPLLGGDDLVSAGLPPGPGFKRILDDTYDAQLEGRVVTREQAMALALQLARHL